MDLNILWFVLIGVLYTGYFILEGFDFGVGMLLPFLGKTDKDRRIIINTIGPHWDGNEVWLITAGGATFAAFPHWYATLFSGFYLPLLLLLLALIIRGVGFEFRSKDERTGWRTFWDWGIFGGSLIPAILWGVAFANLIKGVPIDQNFIYVGGFWNLLNGYALLAGVFSLLLFLLQGAIFLTMKLPERMAVEARKVARYIWLPTLLVSIALVIATIVVLGLKVAILPILGLFVLILGGWFIRQEKLGLGFILNSAVIMLTTGTFFVEMFPDVMRTNLETGLNLTIYNSSSSPYTLKVMSIVALIFVPIVLLYQGWTYWVFRKRISEDVKSLEY
ncbi:MAG: cytochrome d ubiquinol oxidase subunit II [Anaerolineaceae bacterium]|nr:cytochrome d ubiquinol oxidase subunit II [Anaerolineaceae bacterium]